ncbi:hypothetical protein J1N35_042648 [Gossypium stocksii]|uniref:Uncharacterized protein n=1 Tax=Gossypium stocksii TaxID=47602 RepID=A0A9D3U5Y0_9ROSI|nr:hypothetical protein J1N35_042648 [Gossypium stocksii]
MLLSSKRYAYALAIDVMGVKECLLLGGCKPSVVLENTVLKMFWLLMLRGYNPRIIREGISLVVEKGIKGKNFPWFVIRKH